MVERLGAGGPHAVEKLTEGGVAVQVHPEEDRIDEVTDHAFQFGPAPARHGRRHGDVVLPRAAGQQQVETCQQDHEQARPTHPGQPFQPGHERAGQAEAVSGAPTGGRVPGWPVGRQVQRCSPGQAVVPVGAEPVQRRAPQRAPLPGREVRVLDGEFRQVRRPAGGQRRVGRGELAQQDGRGHGVGDDVVHRQHGDVLVGADPQQAHPQQRPLRQVEGDGRLGADEVGHGVRGDRCDGERRRCGRLDDLDQGLLVEQEDAAQHFVPFDERREGPFDGIDLQRPSQPHDDRDVVRGLVGVQLVVQPDALLGQRGVDHDRLPCHADPLFPTVIGWLPQCGSRGRGAGSQAMSRPPVASRPPAVSRPASFAPRSACGRIRAAPKAASCSGGAGSVSARTTRSAVCGASRIPFW